MDLLYFVLCSYGLTLILLYGSIFDKIRPSSDWLYGFGKLFNCPLCMGFWTGAFLFCINNWTELFTFEYTIANFLILGWLSSGTCYILAVLFGDLGFRTHSSVEVRSESEVTHYVPDAE